MRRHVSTLSVLDSKLSLEIVAVAEQHQLHSVNIVFCQFTSTQAAHDAFRFLLFFVFQVLPILGSSKLNYNGGTMKVWH
jgi:hypothetical protein